MGRMEPEKPTKVSEDNRDSSQRSYRSTKTDSRASSLQRCTRNSEENSHSERRRMDSVDKSSKERNLNSDPDRDIISDGDKRRRDGSYYSEDYENDTPSERSLSPFSRSLTPSPTPQRDSRAKQSSRSPLQKIRGAGYWGVSRTHRPGGLPFSQQHRRGPRSHSKESTPPKDLDLVTKRMLSARLLKINELHNALSELQQRNNELQKENRTFRQLQVRQEKALQRYDDTESEISQLLSRHSNEIHALRERLRRTQERERAAERRLKDSEEKLQRSQAAVARLKKLVEQQDLGARDELSRRLEEERTRAQETERKIKDLQRSLELSSSSFQRQLSAEKKKTVSAQEEVRSLQGELERLALKLKEKERELDAKNIYANRMLKPSRDTDRAAKQKTVSSTKAVQTEGKTSSLDFPTPPPAISDCSEPDGYLSLKEPQSASGQAEAEDRPPKEAPPKGTPRESQEPFKQELNGFKDRAKKFKDGLEEGMSENGDEKSKSSTLNQAEENYWKRGHVQEEVTRWNQESLHTAEEARRRKDRLLAKMHEIDRQNQGDSPSDESPLSDAGKTLGEHPSPRPPEQRNPGSAALNETEPEGRRAEAVSTAMRRRALRSQTSSDDLAFGGYAPSFLQPASRASSGFPPPPPKGDGGAATGPFGLFNLRTEKNWDTDKTAEQDKKSNLLQQLFGVQAAPVGGSVAFSNKMELLSGPGTQNRGRSRREGLLDFNPGSSTPPAASVNVLQVADSRPAVRVIPSFDDDIEELAL